MSRTHSIAAPAPAVDQPPALPLSHDRPGIAAAARTARGAPDPGLLNEDGFPYHPALDGHMPPGSEHLPPGELDSVHTETRRLRHDGWTPQRKRAFLEALATCGVVADACRTAGMSARAAYALRGRDPLFDAGWKAACARARDPLADAVYSRAINGVVDRIYRDGCIVAERHRYDNRLTMAVLSRLDAQADRAEARDDPSLRLSARWDDYLDALGEDRREDGLALMQPAPDSAASETASDRELHELRIPPDRHLVWEDEEGWWTDYPPPEDFDGEEENDYGDPDYRRTLTAAEEAVVAEEEAEDLAEDRALAAAQRDAFFGLARDGAGAGDGADADGG